MVGIIGFTDQDVVMKTAHFHLLPAQSSFSKSFKRRLVEAPGIEPGSGSTTSKLLHAYFAL